MAQSILKYHGVRPPQADLDHIDQDPGVTILDRVANRAMLVEAPAAVAQRLDRQLPDWTVAEEVTYLRPGRRPLHADRSEED